MSSQRLRLTAVLTGCLLAVLLAVAVAGLVRSGPDDAGSPPADSVTHEGDAQGAGWTASAEVPAEMNPAAPAAADPDGYALPRSSSTGRRAPGEEGSAAGQGRARERRIVQAVPGSRVTGTHRSAADGRVQVTLTASTTRSQAFVLRSYRTRLQRLGLTAEPARAVGGSVAVTYTGDGDVVVVTATPASGRTTYGVLATLDTGSSRR